MKFLPHPWPPKRLGTDNQPRISSPFLIHFAREEIRIVSDVGGQAGPLDWPGRFGKAIPGPGQGAAV